MPVYLALPNSTLPNGDKNPLCPFTKPLENSPKFPRGGKQNCSQKGMSTVKDIKIRGVSDATLLKLDELSASKNMSRNKYLKIILENLSIMEELKDLEEKYSSLVKSTTEIIKENTKQIKDLKKIILKKGVDELE